MLYTVQRVVVYRTNKMDLQSGSILVDYCSQTDWKQEVGIFLHNYIDMILPNTQYPSISGEGALC